LLKEAGDIMVYLGVVATARPARRGHDHMNPQAARCVPAT
jgi:hypothetical protein